jgi:hypothetical protein
MILIRDIDDKKEFDTHEAKAKADRKEKEPEPIVETFAQTTTTKSKKKKEEEIDPAVIEAARAKKAYETELAIYGVSFTLIFCSEPGFGRAFTIKMKKPENTL